MAKAKLTLAQRDLLVEMERSGAVGMIVAPHYAPARKLVEVGYGCWRESSMGSTYLCITDAGIQFLKELCS